MSMHFKGPMADWSSSIVLSLGKCSHLYQVGPTAWSLCSHVPERHLLIPEDVHPGIATCSSIWIDFLYAFQRAFNNGRWTNSCCGE